MGAFNKEICLSLLRDKQKELCDAGEERYVRRGDFAEQEVDAIKAFLGPWPRALEAAGIKPEREDDRKAKNREKRIRAKRAKNAERRNAQKKETAERQKTIEMKEKKG